MRTIFLFEEAEDVVEKIDALGPRNKENAEEEAAPDVLYKYRDWDCALHKRVLTHREVYYASPKSFNDPFDCTIDIDHKPTDRQALLEKLFHILREKHRDCSEQECREKADRHASSGRYETSEYNEERKELESTVFSGYALSA